MGDGTCEAARWQAHTRRTAEVRTCRTSLPACMLAACPAKGTAGCVGRLAPSTRGLTCGCQAARVQADAHVPQLLAGCAVQPRLHPPLRSQQAEQPVAVHIGVARKRQPGVGQCGLRQEGRGGHALRLPAWREPLPDDGCAHGSPQAARRSGEVHAGASWHCPG